MNNDICRVRRNIAESAESFISAVSVYVFPRFPRYRAIARGLV